MPYPTWRPGERITAARLNALVLSATKPADETVTGSTTMQNDADLFVALEAGRTYRFDALLLVATPDAADIKLGWGMPASANLRWSPRGIGAGVTANVGDILVQSRTGIEEAVVGGGGGSTMICTPSGIITTVGAGTLQLRWAQNAASGSTIVRAQSNLTALLVG